MPEWSKMSPRTSALLLCLANLLMPVALFIFATGFFPYKPFLPGLASYEDLDLVSAPKPPFDKVIFMVVDALRSDFVYSETAGFRFTQSLIASGAAMPYTAHATSPTITMPRIKAMTTGSIPSFLDVILNFAESDTTSTLAQQDTWLAQMRAKRDGKLIMYGDDTWLKLFPDTFSRSDGTTSFFVSDFTEVDNNVTRHVPEELQQNDWNTMIMHFLGLDHIGHKAGPGSPNMVPKQTEMDGIVRHVYQAIEQEVHLESTLFVLCGDHGMNEAGNHGGSAPGETSPALVFISPKFRTIFQGSASPLPVAEGYQYYTSVEQSDIVPTLAGLLGFPVPRNNLGVFIPDFLNFWEIDDQVQIVLQNALQILKIVKATFSDILFDDVSVVHSCSEESSPIERLQCQWKEGMEPVGSQEHDGKPPGISNDRLLALMEFSKTAQHIMSRTGSNYDLGRLKLGIVTAAIALLAVFLVALPSLQLDPSTGLLFMLLASGYGGMMFASSFVEEEQHFWYWSLSGWLAWLSIKWNRHSKTNLVHNITLAGIVLLILRLTRRWNQTGQKFAGEPDIARTFFSVHNYSMWYAVVATYAFQMYSLSQRGFRQVSPSLAIVFSIALCLAALTFKVTFTYAEAPELFRGIRVPLERHLESASLVTQARVTFIALALALAYNVVVRKSTNGGKQNDAGVGRALHDLLTLFLVTQSRAGNIPLFLLFEIQFQILGLFDLSTTEITVTSLLFQYASFFAFGGSNAISTIDLSNAYNGVDGYNVLVVGILTFVSNWTGPLWWASATSSLLLHSCKRNPVAGLYHHLTLTTLFVAISLLGVMAACSVLRTHLFIWTVFSPKYLYIMAWCLGHHLCVNLAGVTLLVSLGCR